MSSIRKVAELAGVSLGSVSRYLNGHQLKEQNMKKLLLPSRSWITRKISLLKGLRTIAVFLSAF